MSEESALNSDVELCRGVLLCVFLINKTLTFSYGINLRCQRSNKTGTEGSARSPKYSWLFVSSLLTTQHLCRLPGRCVSACARSFWPSEGMVCHVQPDSSVNRKTEERNTATAKERNMSVLCCGCLQSQERAFLTPTFLLPGTWEVKGEVAPSNNVPLKRATLKSDSMPQILSASLRWDSLHMAWNLIYWKTLKELSADILCFSHCWQKKRPNPTLNCSYIKVLTV